MRRMAFTGLKMGGDVFAVGHAFGYIAERNAGRVGGDNGIFSPQGLQLFE